MKRYQVNEKEYEKIIQTIKFFLEKEERIITAYLHGSFINKINFGDIDLALYLENISKQDTINYEIKLENKLEKIVSFPVDVRVLNEAPPSFCYSVIKNGILLLNRNDDIRVEFETMTLKKYFDFLPFRQRYLLEVINNEI